MREYLHLHKLCRFGLAFMWLLTAATSFWWGRAIGYEVLVQQQIEGTFADFCIDAGSALDAFMGVWLLINVHIKWCYRVQIAVIAIYTLLLSLIAPQFWLHPFGPLTKNVPILLLLILLHETSDQQR